MTRAFDLALHQAKNMSHRRSPKFPNITIGIDFNQSPMPMAGGGGLSSVQKRMNIGGEPHRLSYINSDEASLLKQLGGLGQPVRGTRGVPAYIGVGDEEGISEDYSVGGHMGGGFSYGAVGPDAGIGPAGKTPGYVGVTREGDVVDPLDPEHSAAAWGARGGYPREGHPSWKESARATPEEKRGASLLPGGLLLGGLYADMIARTKQSAKTGWWGGNVDRGVSDVYGYIDEEYDELMEGESPLEQLLISLSSEEEDKKEEEEKKLRGMEAYFAKMGGKTPLRYTENEKRILERIYPPGHPIWKDINREREPIWPSIEEEEEEVVV